MKLIRLPLRISLVLATTCAPLAAAQSDVVEDVKDEAKEVLTDAKAALFDVMDKNSLVVDFAEGSALLTDAQKGSLTALLQSQDNSARGLKLALASWSDKPFPEPSASLKSEDVDLADARSNAVIAHMRTLAQYRDVEVINMAKRENAVARFFSTDAAKVKNAMDGKGARQPWVEYEADLFKNKGGPTKTVVILYDEARALTH